MKLGRDINTKGTKEKNFKIKLGLGKCTIICWQRVLYWIDIGTKTLKTISSAQTIKYKKKFFFGVMLYYFIET